MLTVCCRITTFVAERDTWMPCAATRDMFPELSFFAVWGRRGTRQSWGGNGHSGHVGDDLECVMTGHDETCEFFFFSPFRAIYTGGAAISRFFQDPTFDFARHEKIASTLSWAARNQWNTILCLPLFPPRHHATLPHSGCPGPWSRVIGFRLYATATDGKTLLGVQTSPLLEGRLPTRKGNPPSGAPTPRNGQREKHTISTELRLEDAEITRRAGSEAVT